MVQAYEFHCRMKFRVVLSPKVADVKTKWIIQNFVRKSTEIKGNIWCNYDSHIRVAGMKFIVFYHCFHRNESHDYILIILILKRHSPLFMSSDPDQDHLSQHILHVVRFMMLFLDTMHRVGGSNDFWTRSIRKVLTIRASGARHRWWVSYYHTHWVTMVLD